LLAIRARETSGKPPSTPGSTRMIEKAQNEKTKKEDRPQLGVIQVTP
jgi:hypothetical protein